MSKPNGTAVARAPLRRWERWGLALLGLGLLTLLGAARWLTPSPAGFGTHQGLGLPECSARVLWNARCPACGMTTSWAHLTRGAAIAACRANTGGLLLGLLAIATVPWALWSAWRGSLPRWSPDDRLTALVAMGIAVVTVVDWLWRLNQGM